MPGRGGSTATARAFQRKVASADDVARRTIPPVIQRARRVDVYTRRSTTQVNGWIVPNGVVCSSRSACSREKAEPKILARLSAS